MSEDNKPRCYDSTRIEQHDPMFSIETSDYAKEIRIVETTSMYPRICLIDNKEHSKRNFAFIEVKDDKVFEQVWKALMQLVSCADNSLKVTVGDKSHSQPIELQYDKEEKKQ